MGIEDVFVWYQQKIGTYDKQQWETRIERVAQIYGVKCHGLGMGYGLSHVQMRTIKPNTELIDLDLATGSSFTKAKPQHGFLKVAKLATLRCLLFPFYGKWWVHQTSRSVFVFVLLIYVAQVINLLIFHHYVPQHTLDTEGISWMEVIIPLLIMWILTLIQSQIVATTPGLEDKNADLKVKNKYSNTRRRSTLRQSRRLEKSKMGKKGEKIQKKLKFKDTVSEQGSSGIHRRSHLNLRHNKVLNVDDDGFESLNGNGSRTSEEEIVPTTNASHSNINADIPKNPTQPQEVEHNVQQAEENNKSEDKVEVNNKASTPPSTSPRLTTPSFVPHWKKRQFLKKIQKEDGSDGSEVEEEGEPNVENDLTKPLNLTSKRIGAIKVKDAKEDNSGSKVQDERSVKRVGMKVQDCNTDSDSDVESAYNFQAELSKRRSSHVPIISVTSTLDSTGDTEDELLTSPEARLSGTLLKEVTKNSTEWIGVTTNSEDCSYSSDIDDVSEAHVEQAHQDCLFFDNDLAPTSILSPPLVNASCIIWDHDEIKEADLSVLDISLSIISKVDSMPASMDYFYIGMVFSTILAFLPVICRLSSASTENNSTEPFLVTEIYRNVTENIFSGNVLDLYKNLAEKIPRRLDGILDVALSSNMWERIVVVIATAQRWILASMVFFLLSVAERTFKQRFLYAKLFSHLTSSRRARKSELPHFRLNKVRNIKTWLSVRSYLKRRGPQRSVDVIVSTAFIVTLLLLTFLCVELLKDTVSLSQYYLEALIWSLGLGVLLLRFMTLGTKINKKYRNLSVLITEQINLHLQMEQKPHKKDELTVANNVLKLAIDLLKELENPFKISGLSANPILYNVTKLVILSALSGVLSEMLGFKLKLHKIKLK